MVHTITCVIKNDPKIKEITKKLNNSKDTMLFWEETRAKYGKENVTRLIDGLTLAEWNARVNA